MKRNNTLSWKEVGYRFRSPSSLFSHAWNSLRAVSSPVIPTRFNKLFHDVKPFTMVSYARLRGLYDAVQHVSRERVQGDIVECGVAQGGSAALLGLALKSISENRRMWLFDTFSGLPAPTCEDPDYEIGDLCTGQFGFGTAKIQSILMNLGVCEDATLVPGLFQDTVHHANIEEIAVLHLDGDWYESIKVCLEAFYDKVAPGGVIQFDDYGYWAGARKAINEFMLKRQLGSRLKRLDYSGRQLVKSGR